LNKLEKGNACFGPAVHQGSLQRCCSAIGREQGGVDIEASETGAVEQRGFDKAGKIDDQSQVWRVYIEVLHQDRVRRGF
jgi:hypothetical protein